MTTFFRRRASYRLPIKYPKPSRPAAWEYAAVIALGLAFAYLAASFI